MSLFLKFVLVIFGLAYLISPFDIIPDLLLPYIGWFDDGLILAALYYLIRHGRLPDLTFLRKNRFRNSQPPPGFSKTRQQQSSSARDGKTFKEKTNNNKKKRQDNDQEELSPYDILGVKPGASLKEIQAAYKEAIKKYHPDKVSHLGEEFSRLANEKFLTIQKAYDTLIKQR